jgi:selenide, water dikinase
MVGFETSDDAAVYRISDEMALLLTVDFFTPIVDDPYDFGRITAANALSDIYAMGGRPLTAMNLLAFPCKMDPSVIAEVLRGGAETVIAAGAVTVGGHTIDDAEPKYGLSVLGCVAPDRVVRNSGARPGCVLFLTKPVGTGLVATAIKRGIATVAETRAAIDSMARLNRGASEAMQAVGVEAATDVTGFGVLGHLHEMALASGCAAKLRIDKLPTLPSAYAYAEAGVKPGRTADVVAFAESFTDWRSSFATQWWDVLCDPQTSGGLLIAVHAERADALEAALKSRGELAARIGRMTEGEAGRITVV